MGASSVLVQIIFALRDCIFSLSEFGNYVKNLSQVAENCRCSDSGLLTLSNFQKQIGNQKHRFSFYRISQLFQYNFKEKFEKSSIKFTSLEKHILFLEKMGSRLNKVISWGYPFFIFTCSKIKIVRK